MAELRNKIIYKEGQRIPLLRAVVSVVGLTIGLLHIWFVFLFGLSLFYIFILDNYTERKISNDFQKEISETQGLKVTDFHTFDGDGLAELEIINRGQASLYYHGYHKFSLRSIGAHSMTFPCVRLSANKEVIGYGGGQTTWLYSGSPYHKWFPEVNTLQELVDKYDLIIRSIEQLPKNPELREYSDPKWKGKRFTLANPDENFRLYTKPNLLFAPINLFHATGPVATQACDLFTGLQYIP